MIGIIITAYLLSKLIKSILPGNWQQGCKVCELLNVVQVKSSPGLGILTPKVWSL